jgi:hypothetical protein
VPRVVKDLLGTKLVAPPSLEYSLSFSCSGQGGGGKVSRSPPPAKDTSCPPAVVGKVAKGCLVIVYVPPSSSGNAWFVVREPTGAHVFLSPSQMLETMSSSVQVVLPQCIPYVLWHGKVAKPFKARPPKLTARRLGLAVPSRRQAHPASMKFSRRRLDHHWLCSLHGGVSSLTAPGRRFGMPHGLLWPA